MKWHPDRNSTGTEEEKAKADKMFKDINEAYTVLSDKEKRQKYDLGAYDPFQPDEGGSAPTQTGFSGGPGRTFYFSSGPGGAA